MAQQLTRKQMERYKAKGKLTGKSPVPSSGKTSPSQASSAASSKTPTKRSIFDTEQARANAAAFTSATGENADFMNMANRMFEVVSAKMAIRNHGPLPLAELDMDKYRTYFFEVLSDCGWERALFILAQCCRLWAELPGPQNFDDAEKALMHTLSAKLTAKDTLLMARAIDKVSRK